MAVTPRNNPSMHKKGIFFTLSAVLIVSLFLLYFSSRDPLSVKAKQEVQEARVTSMNNFAENFENVYVPRTLNVASHNVLNSLTGYIVSESSNDDAEPFYINLTVAFQQAMFDATVYNYRTGLNDTLDGMNEGDKKKTLYYWISEFTNVSRREMNIYIDYNLTEVTINQTSPWKANVTLSLEYNLSSPGVMNLSRKNLKISAEFDIQGFVDPLIAVETKGVVSRIINRSSESPDAFGVNTTIGKDGVKKLVQEGSYIFQNKTAPSFLMRFSKDLNGSGCCGIESLITMDVMTDKDGVYRESFENGERSYTDFQFWMDNPDFMCLSGTEQYGVLTTTKNLNLYSVGGVTEIDTDPATPDFPFKLDTIHMDLIYGIPTATDTNIATCNPGST